MKLTSNTNHDITTIRLNKEILKRLRLYGRYGDTMQDIIVNLLDEHDMFHQTKLRNYKGQFLKKE